MVLCNTFLTMKNVLSRNLSEITCGLLVAMDKFLISYHVYYSIVLSCNCFVMSVSVWYI